MEGIKAVEEVEEAAEGEGRCEEAESYTTCVALGLECTIRCTADMGLLFVMLAAICMGATTFGGLLSVLGFPSITTFLIFGIICGPFCLGFMHLPQLAKLDWVNAIALGYIGMTAGGKLHVTDVKANLSGTLWITLGSVVVPFAVSLLSIRTLGPYFMPFLADLAPNEQLAVGLLFASLAVARSPSSAIAIIEELHAKGPFTTIVLTVTVVVDVVVVMLFAIMQLLVDQIAPIKGAAQIPPEVVISRFLMQTLISVALGWALGKLFAVVIFLFECTVGHISPSDISERASAAASAGVLLLLGRGAPSPSAPCSCSWGGR